MSRPTSIDQFQSGDWERLQEAAERFEQSWRERTDVDLASFLPPADDPLYGAVLEELVKIDLEMRRSRGQAVTLDHYLEKYPQLGDAQTLPARLIYEEYRVQRRFGDTPDLEQYRQRFPDQFAELQRLIDQESLPADSETHPDSSSAAAKPRPSMILQSGETLPVGEGYRLLECIGDGTFGEVWRVEAPGGFPAAIKIVRRTLDSEESQREQRALEVIKRLSHPHLLKTHAAWALQDRLIILMELADGTLRDRMHQCKAAGASGIPPAELLRYFREAAEALDYLHGEGVLHRDVKPQNLLLCRGHVKVADFGLIRDQNQQQRSHSTAGTPGYMAPESWRGEPCEAGDQYGLALTYAELRLGRWPYDATDPYNIMLAHIEGTPDLSRLDEGERIALLRGMAKNPAERFSDCQTFVSALHDALLCGATGAELPEALRPRPIQPTRAMPRFETNLQADKPAYGSRRKAAVTREMEKLPLEGTIFPSANSDADLPLLEDSTSQIRVSRVEKPEKAPGGNWQTASKPRRSAAPWIALGFCLLVAAGASIWYVRNRPPQDTKTSPRVDTPGTKAVPLAKSRIVHQIAGQKVVFVRIQPGEQPNEEPFYLMENKVSNGVFRVFAHEKKLVDTTWERGGIADGHDVGSKEDDLPVLRVTRPEAQRFADWLGAKLPSAPQLDLALGNADPPKAAAVNRIRLGPRKITETHDDISRHDIRDLRGNGREWTRDDLHIKGDDRIFAVLRGRSYTAPGPLLPQHLNEWKAPELCPTQLANYASPYTGFRVVLSLSAAEGLANSQR